MWTCKQCNESVEEDFDVCWSCGSSREGEPDPAFRTVDDPTLHADTGSDTSDTGDDGYETLDDELADRFVCGRCNSVGGNVWKLQSQGRTFAFLAPRLLAVSCDNCGYTELYREGTLGDHRGELDRLFKRRPD